MIIHDDSKKFECDICQTKFNQQRDLNNHKMQKHTGLLLNNAYLSFNFYQTAAQINQKQIRF